MQVRIGIWRRTAGVGTGPRKEARYAIRGHRRLSAVIRIVVMAKGRRARGCIGSSGCGDVRYPRVCNMLAAIQKTM